MRRKNTELKSSVMIGDTRLEFESEEMCNAFLQMALAKDGTVRFLETTVTVTPTPESISSRYEYVPTSYSTQELLETREKIENSREQRAKLTKDLVKLATVQPPNNNPPLLVPATVNTYPYPHWLKVGLFANDFVPIVRFSEEDIKANAEPNHRN